MSHLMGDLFHKSPLVVWPLIALALFAASFLAVVFNAMRKPAADVAKSARLALNDPKEK